MDPGGNQQYKSDGGTVRDVREVSGADGSEENILEVSSTMRIQRSYHRTGRQGTGIIRIADLKTGSFTDMAFAVNTEGVNIVTTNH